MMHYLSNIMNFLCRLAPPTGRRRWWHSPHTLLSQITTNNHKQAIMHRTNKNDQRSTIPGQPPRFSNPNTFPSHIFWFLT